MMLMFRMSINKSKRLPAGSDRSVAQCVVKCSSFQNYMILLVVLDNPYKFYKLHKLGTLPIFLKYEM